MNNVNDCHASTSSQHLHSAAAVTVAIGGKEKRKMCESELPLPLSPLKSTPHFQLDCPETSSRYCHRLVQRMQYDTCFRCRQQGHWARDCPLNSPNPKIHPPIAENSYPKIYCRCGHGFCEVKTAKSDGNYGRSYYTCPIKRGKKCRDFVKWCDDPVDDSDLRRPPYKFPTCSCGAGVCRKEKEKSGPNEGRYYFACPFGEGHGACDFRLWEDTLLGSPTKVPAQQSSQRTLHDFWKGNQVDDTNLNDLGKDGNSPFGRSKWMRIKSDSQYSLVMAGSELPKGKDAVLMDAPMERGDHDETTELSTPPNHGDFPEFEVADDLLDIDMIKSVEAIEEKARSLSRLSTPSRIHSRQREFQRQISTVADASFVRDPCPMHWLGRLVFCHPTISLKFPQPQPFFCCVFPNFNPIIVPRQESKHDGLCGEANQLLISNPGQHEQLSTGCHTEASGDVVSLNLSPGSQRKPISKAQRQRQMVLCVEKQLLNELESSNPLDHESMREAAEATFDLLDSLSVDYKQFSEHVWEFINSTSSLAEIQNSIQNDLSAEEHIRRCEEEKVRLTNSRTNYVKTKALLEESHQRSQSLREEASRLKTMLHEVEDQLTSCLLQTLKMETHLGEINASMTEAEKSLKIAAEQADTARKLSEEKEAKQAAAQTALDKAKLELENLGMLATRFG